MKSRILYSKPSITNLEISYAKDAAKQGWGKNCYKYIYQFEKLFRKHLNVKYAMATSSCTGALHLGMASLGIGKGDEVILADSNWIASVSPVVHLGAKPVFVDILPDTWCIDPNKVEAAITKKTKAILAVHLYGNCCDMKKLLSIGKKYGIYVIEDAAEAIGSEYYGKKVGSIGKFGSFSFHGTKTITTGEGGMFVTNDLNLYKKALALNNHGRKEKEKKQFWSEFVGYKFKISNMQAAIGCAQVKRIKKLIMRKKQIFNSYKNKLKKLDGVFLNQEKKNTKNGFWIPNVLFEKKKNISREKLQKEFLKENIDARVFFWPLSSLPMFRKVSQNINAYDIASRSINLPSYHDITELEIDRVVNVIEKLHGKSN